MAREAYAPIEAEAAGDAQPWALPEFDGPPTAARLEQIEQQAYREGESRGYADGLARGEAAVREQVQQLAELIENLAAPLAEQDTALERELLQLAWKLGALLARRQLQLDPDAVARLVHEALAALPPPPAEVTIFLPAAQVDAVRGALEKQPPGCGWRVEADGALQAGDCRVRSATATADASLDSRLQSLAERCLGTDDAQQPAP